jgi:DNA-binding protein H-NS
MATLQDIESRIQSLRRQAQAARGKAVQRVRKLMMRLGVTLGDLGADAEQSPRRGRGAATKTVGKAKYRDPATGKTWTGHGRAPDWIKNATDRSSYLIAANGSKVTSKPAGRGRAQKAAAAKRK